MKKSAIITGLAILIIGSLVWVYRVPLLLAGISGLTDQRYADRRGTQAVSWSEGPAIANRSINERLPNIVLIVADDLGYNDISTFGGGVAGGRVKTPNIDRLANEGVIFTQSYSGHNTCAPSRAMLMTGRYPSRTGFQFTPTPGSMLRMIDVISREMHPTLPRGEYDSHAAKQKPPYEEMGLPGSETTVAEVLKAAGYYTAHIGKWHLGRGEGMAPTDQGFDDSLLMLSGLYLPEDAPNVVNAHLDFDPIDQFLWASMRYSVGFNESMSAGFKPQGYLTDYFTDQSLKVIEANKHRPFFLYLAHWGVHTPLQATREDYEAVGDLKPHRLRVYAAMIRSLDRSVGRILEKLESEGLSDNTIVLFTSDNGGPGYLGLKDVNAPFRGWKITSFEGGLRVPLFVRWPSRLQAGAEITTPVAHIDVMPTLASAAGSALPSSLEIDGQNLLALTDPNTRDDWARDTLYWVSDQSRVVRKGDWKLQLNTGAGDDGVRKWLFNLANDPTEQHDVSAEFPDRVTELEALLESYTAEARPPLWPATLQGSVMVDKTLAEKFEPGDEYVLSPN